MQNQYIQHGNAAPSVDIKFVVPSTGLSATGLTNATAGLTLAYSRPGAANVTITLASQTVTGAWASGGFVHRGDGVYRLDLPAAAVLTGVTRLTILATALPADVALVSTIIALGPDDLSVSSGATVSTQVMTDLAGAPGASARTAIGVSVDAALADNFAALPNAAAFITALRAENIGSSWGVTSTPVGGSSLTYTERRAGVTVGTRTAFFDNTGKMAGLTGVV
jgi:hypothetical protein